MRASSRQRLISIYRKDKPMWTWIFWKQAIERAVKTAVQAFAALLIVDGFNLLTADWETIGATVATAALASLATSMFSAPVGDESSPSLVPVGGRSVS